jgi:hypothetical protein
VSLPLNSRPLMILRLATSATHDIGSTPQGNAHERAYLTRGWAEGEQESTNVLVDPDVVADNLRDSTGWRLGDAMDGSSLSSDRSSGTRGIGEVAQHVRTTNTNNNTPISEARLDERS